MTWTVADVMTKDLSTVDRAGEPISADVVTTTPGMALSIAASLMFQHRMNLLPVVDMDRRLIGTLSRTQLLKVFLRSDESIRREIRTVLHKSSEIGHGNVDVKVIEGVAHLYGQLEPDSINELLIRLVAAVPGVVGVTSHLNVAGQVLEPI